MIKRIPSAIYSNDYLINFSYETVRHNKKEQTVVVKAYSKENAEKAFWIWMQSKNEETPYRAMLNVKILSVANKLN